MRMKTKFLILLTVIFSLTIPNAFSRVPKKTPELMKRGKELYKINCASCHGDKGDGKGVAAAALPANAKPRSFLGDQKFKRGNSLEKIFETTSKGIPGTMMVAFAHLPEKDRWAVTYYVHSLNKKAAKKK